MLSSAVVGRYFTLQGSNVTWPFHTCQSLSMLRERSSTRSHTCRTPAAPGSHDFNGAFCGGCEANNAADAPPVLRLRLPNAWDFLSPTYRKLR
mmetsp:Transcript_1099/g.1629  ORF Transcript_1099/g.1629 Transcript_1099/m.1629 type:complete len:93 (-) Transcript_1099:73-351(-)